MKVLIVGAGAVGGFIADRMGAAGDDVTLLVRPARAEKLRREGLRLVEADGAHTGHPGVVTAAELAERAEPFELVVLGVKADALAAALDDVAPAVGPETRILPFLNGMGHIEPLQQRFGDRVLGGVLRIGTELQDDGAIRVLAPFFQIELGGLTSGGDPLVTAIAERLRAAGADVAVPQDIIGAMWAKWVFIASIGATTSLMRAPVGDVVAVPEGKDFGPAILREAAATADAAGHPVDPGALAGVEAMLTAAGSPLTSSLSRDLIAGRPTEVEPVLGDLVARAADVNVWTPLLALATLALRIHNRRVSAGG